jgi:hypothetical protein
MEYGRPLLREDEKLEDKTQTQRYVGTTRCPVRGSRVGTLNKGCMMRTYWSNQEKVEEPRNETRRANEGSDYGRMADLRNELDDIRSKMEHSQDNSEQG